MNGDGGKLKKVTEFPCNKLELELEHTSRKEIIKPELVQGAIIGGALVGGVFGGINGLLIDVDTVSSVVGACVGGMLGAGISFTAGMLAVIIEHIITEINVFVKNTCNKSAEKKDNKTNFMSKVMSSLGELINKMKVKEQGENVKIPIGEKGNTY